MGPALVGAWLDTLLGPEGSAVEVHAVRCVSRGQGFVPGWLVSSGPPATCSRLLGCGWGLVGLLFEICIVDASIFHDRARLAG